MGWSQIMSPLVDVSEVGWECGVEDVLWELALHPGYVLFLDGAVLELVHEGVGGISRLCKKHQSASQPIKAITRFPPSIVSAFPWALQSGGTYAWD